MANQDEGVTDFSQENLHAVDGEYGNPVTLDNIPDAEPVQEEIEQENIQENVFDVPAYGKGFTFPAERAKEYRKHKTAMLVKMNTKFVCENDHGEVSEGEAGDYLAQDLAGGFYAISAEFHAENYEEVNTEITYNPGGLVPKILHNSTVSGARKNVKDICIVGDGDTFKLLCKASSKDEGWMKSTKAMQTPTGCVIQVTTQQLNIDGTYSVAEALTNVPGVGVTPDGNGAHRLIKLN